MRRKEHLILLLMLVGCGIMAYVDGILQPGYLAKSAIKLVLFLFLPLLYRLRDPDFHPLDLFRMERKKAGYALLFGITLYGFILGCYFIFRNFFDFSGLTASLTSQTGVNRSNFLYVSLYISFCNSLLEEYFFRGFGFLLLKKVGNSRLAYLVSALLFALYHIAMMIGWYALPVVLLVLLGLFVGGLIFDYVDEKCSSILLSWLIHMFANFAINTVGFLLFAA